MIRPVAAVLLALASALPAGAERAADEWQAGPVVVELFTSQGCAACPPADRMLAELAEREDVLPLALHVDYWDYIGWRDVFADPAYTRRQKAYARAAGERMIYTPQMVVQGAERVVGTRPMALLEAIGAQAAKPRPVALRVEREGAGLRVEARASASFEPPLTVQLVRFAPHRSVAVTRGENAGRKLEHANIVTSWKAVGRWDGRAPLSMRLDVPGDDPAAVLLQEPGPGPILAAARADAGAAARADGRVEALADDRAGGRAD